MGFTTESPQVEVELIVSLAGITIEVLYVKGCSSFSVGCGLDRVFLPGFH